MFKFVRSKIEISWFLSSMLLKLFDPSVPMRFLFVLPSLPTLSEQILVLLAIESNILAIPLGVRLFYETFK